MGGVVSRALKELDIFTCVDAILAIIEEINNSGETHTKVLGRFVDYKELVAWHKDGKKATRAKKAVAKKKVSVTDGAARAVEYARVVPPQARWTMIDL
jgi:hypothetical protein